MASRQQPRTSSQTSFRSDRIDREIMRPIISSDVMGNRNVEVVPVGAWVEPADYEEQPDAIRSAQIEEERMRQLETEKENRLKSFQKEVKQRVWKANQLKRQKLVEEAEQAFERERRVVRQSCLTGDMPRRDTCSHRQDLDMAIRQRLMAKYGEDVSSWQEDTPVLQSHTEESHEATGKARKELISKKVVTSKKDDDKQTQHKQSKFARDINAPTVRSIVDIDMENLQRREKVMSNKSNNYNDDDGEEEEKDCDEDEEAEEDCEEKQDEEKGLIDSDDAGYDRAQVRFAPASANRHTKKKRPASSTKRPSSARLDAILPSTESEVSARLRRQQTAISRRVFMDREREAVRENVRRQQHKKKITSLKREKEEVRHQLESLAQKQSTLVPGTAIEESLEEARLSQGLEGLSVGVSSQEEEEAERRRDDLRRLREMERYLDALRHRLMERTRRKGEQLPALCACGETIWDTHPETCANNCFFYHNHRAYARALQSLLVSVETM